MNEKQRKKHRLNPADYLTVCRIAGTLVLPMLHPMSPAFLAVYALTGLTDVLDGWVARKTKTASAFGARLDSIADLLFYAVMLFCIFPFLWSTLPRGLWLAAAGVLLLRISAYLLAAVKYRLFASLHTYLNKLTGAAVFLIPFLLAADCAVVYCRAVCAVAAVAALEELAIHLLSPVYRRGTKSILQGKRRADTHR